MNRLYVALILCLLAVSISSPVLAEPCALVNDPRDLRFVDLGGISSFLEDELDLQKGLTDVIGREVIDARFRKAGIPDPKKESLAYAIVAREMPVDQLNVCFILKGNVKYDKFEAFAEKRYQRYFDTLKAQKIAAPARQSREARIAGKSARLFPFAFRPSEAVLMNFGQYTLIATVPAGDYSLLSEIVSVLDGDRPMTRPQPDKVTFMAEFVPIAAERDEIKAFENRYDGFVGKTRATFRKVFKPSSYLTDAQAARLEQDLKNGLAAVRKFSYDVGASRQGDGYAYELNMLFRCASPADAARLKEQLTAWVASNAGKNLSEQDLVALRANRVSANGDTCIYTVKLGATTEEQWQFSAMVMTLMLQDRRFNTIFKG
ncbi:MAG TPA: hypothetical protein PLU72_02110 [Candidatus Ozemobacteraceae bacterium]|nr:hypothetical protein [Candidatus Ozemobacteraceae bacterium]HQG27431.1 hypothetical protein [Candidatus Ozemobacteraceae bacterium]